MRGKSGWFVLAAMLLSGAHAHAAGNEAAGKTVFENQCAACHATEPGKQHPVLWVLVAFYVPIC